MANIKSKEKNIRKIKKRTIRNNAIKSQVKTAIKKVKIAIDNKEKNVNELFSKAKKEIDKAVSKGIYHKNKGARKSSRLNDYINKNISKEPLK